MFMSQIIIMDGAEKKIVQLCEYCQAPGPVRSSVQVRSSVKSYDHGHHECLDSGGTIESKFSNKVSLIRTWSDTIIKCPNQPTTQKLLKADFEEISSI